MMFMVLGGGLGLCPRWTLQDFRLQAASRHKPIALYWGSPRDRCLPLNNPR